MNTLIADILESRPDAKPLAESMTARWVLVMTVGWAAQNITAWLSLDQSVEATIVAGLLGLVSFVGALIGVMRRSGIRVPDWLIEVLEAVTREAPKA